MELRHLRYFVAVAEALSFTKAAGVLRLAQPSLTRQVRNLEEEIGVQLLSRANNRVALTPPGRRFLADSKKVLAMCVDSIAAAQRMNRGEATGFNIGYVAKLHYALLAATVGAFRKLCPGSALNLFDMSSAEQYRALNERRIDVGFVGLDPAYGAWDLQSATVGRDHILVAIPAKHALPRQAKVKLADLGGHSFIGMSPDSNPGAREWLLETCASAGFTARILQEATEEAAAIKFVADGLGLAFIAEQFVAKDHPGVLFRALTPPLRRASKIAWRVDNSAAALREYIRIVKDLTSAG
jgi:DNA-binding transcriptional LysR family regulator